MTENNKELTLDNDERYQWVREWDEYWDMMEEGYHHPYWDFVDEEYWYHKWLMEHQEEF